MMRKAGGAESNLGFTPVRQPTTPRDITTTEVPPEEPGGQVPHHAPQHQDLTGKLGPPKELVLKTSKVKSGGVGLGTEDGGAPGKGQRLHS